MAESYIGFNYQEPITGTSTTPYNMSTVTTSLATLASTGDASKFLSDNVNGILRRLLGMYPNTKTSKIIIQMALTTLTVNSVQRVYLLRRTIVKNPFGLMQISSRNYTYIPVTGHSSFHTATTYSDSSEFGGTKSWTHSAVDAIFGKVPTGDAWFDFKTIRTDLGGVAESNISGSKAYTLHYDPVSILPEVEHISPTNSNVKLVFTNPTIMKIDMTIPEPELITEKLPDTIIYTYPFEEVDEDKDSEVEIYARIASGEKMGIIARDNPNQFLKNAQNYLLYHGYLKTGHYN